ncbi:MULTISPECIES: type II toxin-antitoxin system antitoxin HipB [Serratia]|uniref:type II toxin-antitoxin system antitoxin HipB n=1 Tax=Serratia TaxID=613 RepID=UPI00039E7038|nr:MULTISPECIES: type II toxin-antitoxin system antitoxin HipB [Serratia]AYM92036.1 type II toxin-antitoxin system antitoxin HipB [Serratia sp. 3ACOL1]MBC3217084.1 type II toxin-antitoxin system antitoxin HipB [Serratia fonticola]MBC3229717.1 type II toxin-antitoxin system antitoxin HipB [Serratia fonticola]MBL5826009.1 type II toxin-antitoxin system antitoxin HipB [Serratia fonticola]MBL5863940.1 type II toxin-antitoxin system antitoxin HipB [Serratia fonticola]
MMSPPKIYSPAQLANYLKLVRQRNHWTQSDLAGRIGIKQATISNFENNPEKTTLTTLFKILQSLEMSMVVCEKNDMTAVCDKENQQELDW